MSLLLNLPSTSDAFSSRPQACHEPCLRVSAYSKDIRKVPQPNQN